MNLKMSKKIIKHIDDKCYGCKTCELVCSFHHNKKFQPAKSSISVERDNINGIWKWTLNDNCDNCEKEEEPLCVKFCFYDAIIIVGEED